MSGVQPPRVRGITLLRYGSAIAAAIVAAAMGWGLAHVAGTLPPLLISYPAVLLVALMAGGGPGLLTAAVAALLAGDGRMAHMAPATAASVTGWTALGLFLGVSVAVCVLAEHLRRGRRAGMDARRAIDAADVVVSALADAVIATDVNGRVVWLNDAAERLLGCSRAEAEGAPLAAVFAPVSTEGRTPLTALVDAVLRRGSLTGTVREALFTLGDGSEIPIELSGARIPATPGAVRAGKRRAAAATDPDAAGEARGVVLTVRDITERRQTEKEVLRLFDAVRAEKEWLAQVLGSIEEEVYFTNLQRRYTFANRAALREFGHVSVAGVEVEKVIANLKVMRADGSPRPASEAPPLRALAGEIVRDEEQILRTPRTGELRHRQVSAAPVHDAQGKIIGSVSVVRDITGRKRAEAALREADQRRNEFVTALANQLRNHLAPVRTAARLLECPQLNGEELQRCQSIIARQVAEMAGLLDALLDAVPQPPVPNAGTEPKP